MELVKLIRGGLTAAGAPSDACDFFIASAGIEGGAALAYLKIAKASDRKVSGEWVRRRSLLAAEIFDRCMHTDSNLLRAADLVRDLVLKVEKYSPGSEAAIARKLAKYDGIADMSPVGIVRCAGLFGLPTPLCVVKWVQPGSSNVAVLSVVRSDSACDYPSLIGLSRRAARSAGVVSVQRIATAYAEEHAATVSDEEVTAVLAAFAESLGRHEDEDWYIFRGITAEFPKKVAARVKMIGEVTLPDMVEFHNKYNRSKYVGAVPPEVLEVALMDFGLSVSAGRITFKSDAKESFIKESRIQAIMIKAFRDLVEAASRERGQAVATIARSSLIEELESRGIKPTTAQIYLTRFGLFKCEKGRCKLVGQASG